jgi:hypothetical protein
MSSSEFIPLSTVRNCRYAARLTVYAAASYNAIGSGSSIIDAYFEMYAADQTTVLGTFELMPNGDTDGIDVTNELAIWTSSCGVSTATSGAVWGRFIINHKATFTPNMWLASAELRRLPPYISGSVTNQSIARSPVGAPVYASILWTSTAANEAAFLASSSNATLRFYEGGPYTIIVRLKATSSVAGGTTIRIRIVALSGTALATIDCAADLFDKTLAHIYLNASSITSNSGVRIQVAHDSTAAVTFTGTVHAVLSH